MSMDEYDKRVMKAILGKAQPLTPDEIEGELSQTAGDYDDWVAEALHARIQGRIQVGPDGCSPEHPTARVFRVGIESIRDGKTSEVFLTLLEQIAERAESHDMLNLVFPETFPRPILDRQLAAAEKQFLIIYAFRDYVRSKVARNLPYSEIKKRFKINMQERGVDAKAVDRALDVYGIDFSARPGPKARRKPE